MAIRIEAEIKNKIYKYYIHRMTRNLLKVIPKSHTIGLNKILITDEFNSKNKKNIGLYWRKSKWRASSIEISYLAVYEEKPLRMFIPCFGKGALALVLYHEIGHHYHHRLRHGINKEKREDFADKYEKHFTQRAFRKWRWILVPIAGVIDFISGKKRAPKKNRESDEKDTIDAD
jgi:hypothetical protein